MATLPTVPKATLHELHLKVLLTRRIRRTLRKPLSPIRVHSSPPPKRRLPVEVTCEVGGCKGRPPKFCRACTRHYRGKHYSEHKECCPERLVQCRPNSSSYQ